MRFTASILTGVCACPLSFLLTVESRSGECVDWILLSRSHVRDDSAPLRVAMAVDSSDRLFIADRKSGLISVYDWRGDPVSLRASANSCCLLI